MIYQDLTLITSLDYQWDKAMSNTGLKVTLFIILFTVTGCVATGKKFTKSVPEHSNESFIYIYRPSKFVGIAQRPDVKINDTFLGTLESGGFLIKRVLSGSYLITLTGNNNPFKWNYSDRKTRITTNEGSIYYFRYLPSSYMQGASMMLHSYSFSQVSESEALKELENLNQIE
ncbi:MAG: DUF2846 domain-containing protein [Deltaproteobacteria bacterium]|nr:DUF2846 domain-containing protein [Deltaproteobacteria bacterium]